MAASTHPSETSSASPPPQQQPPQQRQQQELQLSKENATAPQQSGDTTDDASESQRCGESQIPGDLSEVEVTAIALADEQIAALRDDGYVVVDGFLAPALARQLRAEAAALAASKGLPEHKWVFGKATLRKPNIYEADLHDASTHDSLPSFAELYFDDTLVATLDKQLPEMNLVRGPAGKSLKLQHNKGSGGCFPLHYDNAGRPSRRAITCVVYLNPEWKQRDGGEITLQPFLGEEVVIPPLMGRAVLFRSDRILHRVRPSVAERFCYTIWLDSATINGDADCNLTARHLVNSPDNIRSICQSPVQRALSRAVYAEAYEASLQDCMSGEAGCEAVVAEHRAHVERQCCHPQLGPFIEHLRSLRPVRAADGAAASAAGSSETSGIDPACKRDS